MDFLSIYCLVYTLFIPLLFDHMGLLLVLLTCPSAPSKGVSGPAALCFSPSPLSECAPVSLPQQRMPCLRPTTLWLRPWGHMSHFESSLPEYLLIGLHLRYSGRVSLITFISQYGFGLVGFHIWLVVRTSRPDGPTTSQGFRPTLLVTGFCSSRSFLDLFWSIWSLPLCPSTPLSHMLPRSLHISGPGLETLSDGVDGQVSSTSRRPVQSRSKGIKGMYSRQ